MMKIDELRKTIEKNGNSQRFAIALLLPDSNYFIEYLFGQSGPTTHQGLAIRDAVEKAGVRQDLTADEKELISGIITKAFIAGFTYGDNWKNKSAGTKAKAAKFFNTLADALKENKDFSDIIVTYLGDEMLDQVKLVTDDNNTIAKVAMWIIVRSVMIPVTPICADAESSNTNVHVDTNTGKVVVDVEYHEVESTPVVKVEPEKIEQKNDKPSTDTPKSAANDEKDIVDKRNDAIVKAVAALKELGIPDDKIYETLGIKTVSGGEGGTVKASTSYRNTSEEKKCEPKQAPTGTNKPDLYAMYGDWSDQVEVELSQCDSKPTMMNHYRKPMQHHESIQHHTDTCRTTNDLSAYYQAASKQYKQDNPTMGDLGLGVNGLANDIMSIIFG